MIYIDDMRDMYIYNKPFIPPIGDQNKLKECAIMMLTPNYESSKKIMNSDLIVKRNYYKSYYIEKDISLYIKEDGSLLSSYKDDTQFITEGSSKDIIYKGYRDDIDMVRKYFVQSVIDEMNAHYHADLKYPIYVHLVDSFKQKVNTIEDDTVIMYGYDVYDKNKDYKKYCLTRAASLIIYNLNKTLPKNLINGVALFEVNKYLKPEYKYSKSKSKVVYTIADAANRMVEKEGYGALVKSLKTGNYAEILKYTVVSVIDRSGMDRLLYDKDDEVATESTENFDSMEVLSEYVSGLNDDIMITENFIKSGNSMVLFEGDGAIYKRYIYNERLKTHKDVFDVYDKVKADNVFIRNTFLEYRMYRQQNLFIDLSFYNNLFFKNNNYRLKRGADLYFEFMNRLINDPRIAEAGYKKKLVVIPIRDWHLDPNTRLWMYNEEINPISMIKYLLDTNFNLLKDTFKDTEFIFLGDKGYFKLNLEKFDIKNDRTRFLIFIKKLSDPAYVPDDDKQSTSSPTAIALNIINKIESSQNITIPNVSAVINNKKSISTIVTSVSKPTPEDKEDDRKFDVPEEEDAPEEDKVKDELVDAVVKASATATDEDQALDNLDDDERIKKILVDLASEEVGDSINKARASRILKLQEDLLDKDVKGKKIKDMLNEDYNNDAIEPMRLNIDTVNKEWENLTYVNYNKNYDPNADIVAILNSLSKKSRPVSIVNIKVDDTSTSEDSIETYTVNMEDANGQRFTIKFDVPIIIDNYYMTLRGNSKSINVQSFLMPVLKTGEDTVQIVSSYNKIFISRFGTTTGKSFVTADRLIKALSKNKFKWIKIYEGDNTKICSKYELPIDYVDMASVYSKIEMSNVTIYFNQDELRKTYKVDDSKGLAYGVYTHDDGKEEVIYFTPNEDFRTFSYNLLYVLAGSYGDNGVDSKALFDAYDATSLSVRYTYSRASILSTDIPLIVVCAYSEGLQTVLKKAGIKYDLVGKRPKYDKNKQDIIKFNDGFLIYDLTYESSLLMNGLKVCNTEDYSLGDINNRYMYIDFLDLFGGRLKADGLDAFYDLMIDEPITFNVLKHYKLPTDYVSVLLHANLLLSDNKFIKHTDYSVKRLKRNELVAHYTYKAIADSYQEYMRSIAHGRSNSTMTMKQSAIIDAILSSNISSDISLLNPLAEYEAYSTVSSKGPSGMNADRAYDLDKRGYDESMLGVVAMSTGFAANVGINRQLTIDANIESSRGYVKVNKNPEDLNVTKALCMTEALTPYGTTHDDPFRTAMTFIQTSKHGVRTTKSDPLLITNGADEALPYMISNIFAYKAKKNGSVVEMTESYMIVQYDDGTSDFIDLSERVVKNSSGGFFVIIKLDTELKLGSKIKANQLLAYDKQSFSTRAGSTDNPSYNIGKLCCIGILNTDEGYEDSAIISHKLSSDMASDIVVTVEKTFPKNTEIYNMVKPGQHVEEGESLMVIQSPYDEDDVNVLLKNLIDDEDEISNLGRINIKSKITGEIQDVVIKRTVEVDELSDSLKKFVNAYEKPIIAKRKMMEKYGIAGVELLPAHYKLDPIGKLKGAEDSVRIEFQIKYHDELSVGDKIIYYSALKGVIKYIIPEGQEPYTDYRKDEKLDALLAIASINGRMVCSIELSGCLNTVLIEMTRHCKDLLEIKYEV